MTKRDAKIDTIDVFGNDSQVLQIGGLNIENATDRVVIYGDLTITPTEQGWIQAKTLQAFANQLVARLEAGVSVDEAPAATIDSVDNPFL